MVKIQKRDKLGRWQRARYKLMFADVLTIAVSAVVVEWIAVWWKAVS